MEVKVIANYLPQFYRTPQNDEWWGEGYTDWVAAKEASPLFDGHVQPRVPLDNHYYSLDDIEEISWQADLARRYGVYGFGIYHYWFSEKQHFLEAPPMLLLDDKTIDINFMFIWDNGSWKRSWSAISNGYSWAKTFENAPDVIEEGRSGMLAELIYGDKDAWRAHFEYLLPFFKDSRYIKVDSRPMFGFMRPENNFTLLTEMIGYWDQLAKEHGFNGMFCMSNDRCANRFKGHRFKNRFTYAPFQCQDIFAWFALKLKRTYFKKDGIEFFDYDKLWKGLLRFARHSEKHTFLSGFVGYDESPRRGEDAKIVLGESPQKFEKYMSDLLAISKRQGKEYVFLSAWNEWGEGMYMEPDTDNEYAYLEALQAALASVNR